MKNQRQGLVVAGVLFWLGMFSVILYQEKGPMSPLLITAAFVICFIGGVFFFVTHVTFSKVCYPVFWHQYCPAKATHKSGTRN